MAFIDMRLVNLDEWRSMPNRDKERVAKAIANNRQKTNPSDPHIWGMTFTHLLGDVDCPQDLGYDRQTILDFISKGDSLQAPSRRERSLVFQNIG